jgi:hypothetical protein
MFMKQFYLEICHANMIQRCTNERNPDFRFYGGGCPPVTICKRWLGKNGCINFIRDVLRSIGPRPEGINPKTGLSCYHLDRIDNNLGYAIGNLRWAAVALSQKNKRPPRRKGQEYAGMLVNASAQISGCDSQSMV